MKRILPGLSPAFFLGAAMLAMLAGARAQAPAPPPPPEGNIYSVTYVEVMPASKAAGLKMLKQYRDATRKEDGLMRCELAERIGDGHQFVILEIWKDFAAYQAHGKSPALTQSRDAIAAIRNAPTDERVHIALNAGQLDVKIPTGTYYVVTHVDVIPPHKDNAAAALKQLADDSRKGPGNIRFEVVQQTNRANHFTVMEVWKDEKSVLQHSTADTTRGFRDKLGPMLGALYDERAYRPVN